MNKYFLGNEKTLKGNEMAISKQKEQDIILLRAEGYSLDKIKEKVKVSKPTLMKILKGKEQDIHEMRKEIDRNFLRDYRALRTKRAKGIISALEKAYTAIEKTEYEKLAKRDLIFFIATLEQKLLNIRNDMREDPVESDYQFNKLQKINFDEVD
jgi:hypothetical protein